ncbi:MAG TPA: ABC transporter ATP-binding protein, partial [Desulfobacteraceae bacterium]|nr:ABC transporter ATP-binding protein [Desulfobacteraceae bacterium]
NPRDNGVEVAVVSVENLGAYKIVTAKMGESLVKINLPEEQAVPADRAWLTFPKEWVRIYADEYLV